MTKSSRQHNQLISEDEESPQAERNLYNKPSWHARFKLWWNLPRALGIAAAGLGLLHYLPIPFLPVPGLMQLHADIAPEFIGIGITIILIDWAVEKRQQEELKSQLIRQMGSPHNEVADSAVRELAHHGWLYDGSLNRAHLWKANLKETNLKKAILKRVNLTMANLISVDSEQADLREAYLLHAELGQANLWGSNLTQSDLSFADLGEANLWRANLSGALLRGANLDKARLLEANLSNVREWSIEQLEKSTWLEGTIMPDGVRLGQYPPESLGEQSSPTFDEWKNRYLIAHGGTETDMRDIT